MAHNLDESTTLLARTPAALDALLRGLPEIWTLRDEGLTPEGKPTFTVRDVVAHLIHADRTNWMPRVKHILTFGESEPDPARTSEVPVPAHIAALAGRARGAAPDPQPGR